MRALGYSVQPALAPKALGFNVRPAPAPNHNMSNQTFVDESAIVYDNNMQNFPGGQQQQPYQPNQAHPNNQTQNYGIPPNDGRVVMDFRSSAKGQQGQASMA